MDALVAIVNGTLLFIWPAELEKQDRQQTRSNSQVGLHYISGASAREARQRSTMGKKNW